METTITLTKEQADAMADYEPSPEAMKNLYAAADRYRERNMLEHGTDKPVMPCVLDLTGDSTTTIAE